MTYETYRLIFIGGAAMTGVMLIVTVILLFVLRIPAVIGDLTGRTAKKAISNIRNQNEVTGEKTYKSSVVNRERGKLTEKISPSGRLEPREAGMGGAMQTSQLSADEVQQSIPDSQENYYNEFYPENGETEVLSSEYVQDTWGSEPVQSSANETTILSNITPPNGPMFGDTVVLDKQAEAEFEQPENVFEIEYEIRFVSADESLL